MGVILYIKTMVCVRCRMAVQAVLEENGIPWSSVTLGRATLEGNISGETRARIREGLKRFELELIEDKSVVLVESIKTEIRKLISAEDPPQLKLSVYLSEQFGHHYTYLSNLFSELEEISLERFFITERIERVKELIVYEDHSFADIADLLHFSSTAHFSQQFKKVTGMTPAVFRKRCGEPDFEWREG